MKWRKVKPESHYQRRRRAKKKRRKSLEEVQNIYCIKTYFVVMNSDEQEKISFKRKQS